MKTVTTLRFMSISSTLARHSIHESCSFTVYLTSLFLFRRGHLLTPFCPSFFSHLGPVRRHQQPRAPRLSPVPPQPVAPCPSRSSPNLLYACGRQPPPLREASLARPSKCHRCPLARGAGFQPPRPGAVPARLAILGLLREQQ